MLTRRKLLQLAVPGLAVGLRPSTLSALNRQQSQENTSIYIWEHSGSKGCCGPWAQDLASAGFKVQMETVIHANKLRADFNIPEDLWSCHTAVIEAYIVEGHVPVTDIQRLLDQRPFLNGLAAPDFLDENGNVRTEGTFDVIAFRGDGSREVFATHTIHPHA